MLSICIIIPCFNEANRLPIEAYKTYIAQATGVKFCFYNDGSTDQTEQLLQQLKQAFPAEIIVLNSKHNQGKGEAIRRAVLQTASHNFDWYAYWDADLATPLSEIAHFVQYTNNTKAVFLCGSRIQILGRTIERSTLRHYLGRVFATLASKTLRLAVYDTQCGAKFIHKSIVQAAFHEPFISKWLFDVEIFARLIKEKGRAFTITNTIEIPLYHWKEIGHSKVKLIDVVRVPLQLIAIKRRYLG